MRARDSLAVQPHRRALRSTRAPRGSGRAFQPTPQRSFQRHLRPRHVANWRADRGYELVPRAACDRGWSMGLGESGEPPDERRLGPDEPPATLRKGAVRHHSGRWLRGNHARSSAARRLAWRDASRRVDEQFAGTCSPPGLSQRELGARAVVRIMASAGWSEARSGHPDRSICGRRCRAWSRAASASTRTAACSRRRAPGSHRSISAARSPQLGSSPTRSADAHRRRSAERGCPPAWSDVRGAIVRGGNARQRHPGP